MPRLDRDILDRVENFAHRVCDVVDVLAEQKRSFRLMDQIAAAGTSVAANCFEADEAMSRGDFCRCLAIALKELSETRFWLRFVVRRGWLPEVRIAPLEQECCELMRVFGSMIARTKRTASKPVSRHMSSAS